MYRNIRNASQLYNIANEKEIDSYKGVSLILQSLMYQQLTDIYGDIPFSEAVSARAEEAVLQPAYDAQRDVYMGIITKLKEANTLLSANDLPSIKGDIIHNGDLENWRKFGNSLLLRVYMRLSNVEPQIARDGIKEIAENPSAFPVINSNAENTTLTYLANNPNVFPLSEASGYRVGSFNEYRMSETLELLMKDLDDPRMRVWFNPTSNSVNEGTAEWAGMLNGVVDGTAYSYKGGDKFLSKFSDMFFFEPNSVEGMIMMHSEVEFIFAEAAQRGWISSDAKTHYENGIKSNFEYWGVDLPADYLERAGVAYDDNLETIMTQKWLALFYIDYQGFCEFKRTGYPDVIVPGPDAFYDTYPSRFIYPSNEQAANNENRLAAISNMGASQDDIRTPVWWENK
jgi:hypothetical protein